jgi:glycosyltransferase involved in cell wall biosynthesis
MAKKKVLYVITKSNWGGAQRYVFDLASNLPKDTFDVAVLLGGTGAKDAGAGLLAAKLQEARIPIIFIRSFMRDVSLLSEWHSFKELLKIFKTEQPDVVHLNSSKAGALGALAARIAGTGRIIFTVHGWPFLEKRNAAARALIYLLSWFTALLCHTVITISNYDLRAAKAMPGVGHKAVRVYNGIDQDAALGSGDLIRNAFPLNTRITGTVGELNKNKNQIALIEEAKKNSEMYVAIVGEGEDRAMLEKSISEYGLEGRVKLFGFLPASEALRGFDTFALPSLKEGLPYVLLEAKAAGLPITANRVGGVGEILDATDMQEFSLERMVKKTVALY